MARNLNIPFRGKPGYEALSANLGSIAPDIPALAAEFAKWKGVDLVAAYHHPELGLLTANPKSAKELAAFGRLEKNELLVIFAGKGSSPDGELCRKAAELAIALFEGKKVRAPAALLRGNFPTPKKPAAGGARKKPALVKKAGVSGGAAPHALPAPSCPVKMTPRYAVVVGNELFHNGNVEAWKRIIASYHERYPSLKVSVYYEGERIVDINALFKWGKVKHGRAIEFAVAGSEIRDVAKLQRYLSRGASPHFEEFLRGLPGSVLKLF